MEENKQKLKKISPRFAQLIKVFFIAINEIINPTKNIGCLEFTLNTFIQWN